MKIKTIFNRLAGLVVLTIIAIIAQSPSVAKQPARVIDNNPVTDQRWIISEIYLGTDDYKGAYIELYNNDEHTSLGWKDFVINLPFDIDYRQSTTYTPTSHMPTRSWLSMRVLWAG